MKKRLHNILGASAVMAGVALISAGIAQADGMPAPVYRTEVPCSWTGFYTGANAGWSRQDFDWAFNPAISGAPHQAFNLGRNEAEYGAMVGYNYQFGAIVVGLEVGWDKIGFTDAWARAREFGNNPAFQAQTKLDNVLTIGHALALPSTGGSPTVLVVMPQERSGLAQSSTHRPNRPWCRGNRRTTGTTVGSPGGLEYAATNHFIIGLEYQHVGLETGHETVPNGVATFSNRDVSADADIVRARFSYKWGGDFWDRGAPLK